MKIHQERTHRKLQKSKLKIPTPTQRNQWENTPKSLYMVSSRR